MGIVEKLHKLGFIEHYSRTRDGYTIRFAMGDNFNLKDFKDFFEDFGLEVVNVKIVRGFLGVENVIIYLEGKQYAE